MNTQTNHEAVTTFNMKAFTTFVFVTDEAFMNKAEKKPITEEELSKLAAKALDEYKQALENLEQFSTEDYRNVDAAKLRWCVAQGASDPLLVMRGYKEHCAIEALEAQEAFVRLAGGDTSQYVWNEYGKAVCINYDYAA